MTIRELLYYYRSNKIETIVFVSQIAVFFVLIGTFFAFTSEVHYRKSDIEKIYKDKAIYQLLDGYYDPDEFEAFREEPNALNILKEYYNGLNTADSFEYLAMFNQRIIIHDIKEHFPKELAIEAGSQQKRVESFQINAQACDYFNLTTTKGRTFNQSDFDDYGDVVPIIVGANYLNTFNIGDKISATYYQKDITLEVVGILRENTFVYFNGDSEFYLDEYIILPYINYDTPKTEFEEWFQEVVYFAMINGYISVNIGDEFVNDMMMELESISEKTGFYNYVFIGANPNIQQYRGLINIMNQNYNLIKVLLILSFFINMITIGFQLYMMQKKRSYSMAVHYLNGATLQDIIKQFSIEVLLIISASTSIGWIVLTCLKISDFLVMLIILVFAVVLMMGICSLSIYKLKNAELMLLLNQEDDLQ